MKESFATRLKMGLELRNMKPVELSEKSNISKSRISQYLKGSYEAKQDALYKIAKALDVSEAWLMGYDTSIERHTADELVNHAIQTKLLINLDSKISKEYEAFMKEHEIKNEIITIAAHAIEDLTEEEQIELLNYAEWLKTKRKTANGK